MINWRLTNIDQGLNLGQVTRLWLVPNCIIKLLIKQLIKLMQLRKLSKLT